MLPISSVGSAPMNPKSNTKFMETIRHKSPALKSCATGFHLPGNSDSSGGEPDGPLCNGTGLLSDAGITSDVHYFSMNSDEESDAEEDSGDDDEINNKGKNNSAFKSVSSESEEDVSSVYIRESVSESDDEVTTREKSDKSGSAELCDSGEEYIGKSDNDANDIESNTSEVSSK
jgi:hypothetical protein